MECSQFDLLALTSTVRVQLEENRDYFNQLDTTNGNHGDHLLAVWERVAATVREYPDSPPEALLGEIGKSLEHITSCNTARAYALVTRRLARRFAAGDLTLDAIADLAQRLVKGLPPDSIDADKARSAGRLAETLLRQIGGQGRLRELADRFGIAELFSTGIDAARAAQAGRPALHAGVAFLVSNSPLGYAPHRKISAQLVLKTLLVEINRQA